MPGPRTRDSRMLPRWPIAVAVVVVVASAWFVGTRGVAHALATASPEQALVWHAGNAEALVRVNELETDPARKVDRARRVLSRRPLDGRAYRQLAEVAEGEGDDERALALHAIAARHSPRDRLSRAWLADHAHARGAHAETLRHVDALLRMDAALREPLFDRMALLSSDEGFRSALVRLLLSKPAWRAQYLTWWETRPGSPHGLDAVHRALADSGNSLGPAERMARVERLLHEHRWDDARRVWAGGRDRPDREHVWSIVNGGFEQDPKSGFDWRIAGGAAHRTGIASDADGNRALRVELLGPGVQLGEIAQLLVLAPGSHVVSVRVRRDALRAERGLVVTVACADAQRKPLGMSRPVRGSGPWRRLTFEVEVPASCPAQWLGIELAAPALDRLATGVAWFDDFAVRSPANAVRTPVEAAPPAFAEPPPSQSGFRDAVAAALARVDDRYDRDAPFGP